jgi:hypothetical protein
MERTIVIRTGTNGAVQAKLHTDAPEVAALPNRDKFPNALADWLAAHPFNTTNDPRFKTLLDIAEAYSESADQDANKCLRGCLAIDDALAAFSSYSSFGTEPSHFGAIAAILRKVGSGNALKVAVRLGQYEGWLQKPIPSQPLDQIGDALAHLTRAGLYSLGQHKSPRTLMWKNHEVYSSPNLEVLDALIDKGLSRGTILSPRTLANYLSLISKRLLVRSPRGEYERETSRLKATVSFITNQPELVPLKTLQAFLNRISELPARDTPISFNFGTSTSMAQEYERYQRRFGSPLLSENEHSFFHKLLDTHRGDRHQRGIRLRTARDFLEDAIPAVWSVSHLRNSLGREFSQYEQDALVSLQREGNGRKHSYLEKTLMAVAKNHPSLLAPRLHMVNEICLTHGVCAPDATAALGQYLAAMDEAEIPLEAQQSRLECLSSFMARSENRTNWGRFLPAVVQHDRHSACKLPMEEFRKFAEIAWTLEGKATESSVFLKMLCEFERSTPYPLIGERLYAAKELVLRDGSRCSFEAGRVHSDLSDKVCKWERERGAPLTLDEFAGLCEMYRVRKIPHDHPLKLSRDAVALLFTYLKNRGIEITPSSVVPLRDIWLDLEEARHSRYRYSVSTATFSEVALKQPQVFGPEGLEFADFIHAFNLLGRNSNRKECVEALLQIALQDGTTFRALDTVRFDA